MDPGRKSGKERQSPILRLFGHQGAQVGKQLFWIKPMIYGPLAQGFMLGPGAARTMQPIFSQYCLRLRVEAQEVRHFGV